MKKVKVIHIITKLAIGGAQETVLMTVENLNKNAFDSVLISGIEVDDEGSLLDLVRRKKIPFSPNKYLVRAINPLKDLYCFWTLRNFISHQQGYIVHTHSSKAGIVGRFAAYLAGSRIVIHTVHGWNFYQRRSTWGKILARVIERIVAKFTAKLICVSKEDVISGLKNRIGEKEKYQVIRSGFKIDDFRKTTDKKDNIKIELDLPLEKKIVGTVGRLAYPKEPEDFIQIAQLISRRRDDTIFVHAGGGVQRNAIERMIQELGLGRMVFLLGPRKDIEKIFSIFDVFLLTSVWEGLPIVIPQAIASGVPVVSTDVGGIREIIKHGKGGFLTKPGNIHDLAFFVEKLLDDEELRSRFVTYSDKIVNEFTHKRMIEDIENLYLDLVGKI